MGDYIILIVIAFCGGYVYGKWTTKNQFENVFRQFSDEMHNQYLYLLKRHGITK